MYFGNWKSFLSLPRCLLRVLDGTQQRNSLHPKFQAPLAMSGTLESERRPRWDKSCAETVPPNPCNKIFFWLGIWGPRAERGLHYTGATGRPEPWAMLQDKPGFQNRYSLLKMYSAWSQERWFIYLLKLNVWGTIYSAELAVVAHVSFCALISRSRVELIIWEYLKAILFNKPSWLLKIVWSLGKRVRTCR